MPFRTAAARRHAGALPALCVLALALAGCSRDQYPQTALLPLSDFARIGDHVQDQTFYWALGVFVLVEGALLYSIFRFRGRPDDPEPSQIHGNTTIEVIWTLIPALILAAIAVPTVKGIFETSRTPPDAMKIEVIGHQWWWEFRYPDAGVTTANEMYIPQGRTVELLTNSADVVHSFWPPRFAGKRDVFPGRETRLWWKADSTGLFPGQCAEYCGIQHARMAFHVRSVSSADFDAWIGHMQTLGPKAAPAPAAAPAGDSLKTASAGGKVRAPRAAPAAPQKDTASAAAPQGPEYAKGEKLFMTKGCMGCHSLQAVKAPKGLIGPNLANVGARSHIAAGWLKNTDENLERWIREPQTVKKGVLMPNLGVTEEEARALRAYLRAHK
jgi:cytochrome c oxidase subunit II